MKDLDIIYILKDYLGYLDMGNLNRFDNEDILCRMKVLFLNLNMKDILKDDLGCLGILIFDLCLYKGNIAVETFFLFFFF
jgi:hypothetical protein